MKMKAVSLLLALVFLVPCARVYGQTTTTGASLNVRIEQLRLTNSLVDSSMKFLEAKGWSYLGDGCVQTIDEEGREVLMITYTDGDAATWEGVSYGLGKDGVSYVGFGQINQSTGVEVFFHNAEEVFAPPAQQLMLDKLVVDQLASVQELLGDSYL